MIPPTLRQRGTAAIQKFSFLVFSQENKKFGNMEDQDSQGTTEPSSPGGDFEPTAEMMVNDFDDERTLDEEEALEEGDDQQNELKNLEKEKDMPIEALLAMYGYNEPAEEQDGSQSSSSEDILSSQDLTLDKEEIGRDILGEGVIGEGEDEERGGEDIPASEMDSRLEHPPEDRVDTSIVRVISEDKDEEPSLLHELYKDSSVGGSRHLRSGSRQHSEDEEDEDEECDSSPEEDDWKKTIMVGSDYQASIPDGLCKYDDAMPYENEDKLLWNPCQMLEKDVREYLTAIQEMQDTGSQGIQAIPRGSHIRDDEQALYLLLQCGHNLEEALRRQKINSISTPDTMSLWSEEECRNFETGLRTFGKDFHVIQLSRVRTRSVSELVQFYYLWKKTERHDVFANKARLEKKKYTLHPGTTDFMERFLDEQDSPVTSPNVHSLLSGDPKRQSRQTPPIHPQSSEMELITIDESRILNSHFENIANHLNKEGFESLYKLTTGATAETHIATTISSSSDTVTVSLTRAPPSPYNMQIPSQPTSESLVVSVNHSSSNSAGPTAAHSYAQ